MIGMVHVAAVAPREVEVRRQHDLGPEPAIRGREIPAQRHAVLDRAVGMAEELDPRDADDRGALPLFFLA